MALIKTIFGSLTLALALALAAPAAPALACGGGYGAEDPEEANIRAVALEHVLSVRHSSRAQHVANLVSHVGDRAEVMIVVTMHEGDRSYVSSRTTLHLRRSDAGWAVQSRADRRA